MDTVFLKTQFTTIAFCTAWPQLKVIQLELGWESQYSRPGYTKGYPSPFQFNICQVQ